MGGPTKRSDTIAGLPTDQAPAAKVLMTTVPQLQPLAQSRPIAATGAGKAANAVKPPERPGEFTGQDEWCAYVECMVHHVREALPAAMTNVGGYGAVKNLDQVAPLAITMDGFAFRAAWSPVDCRQALERNGLYEGNGTAFWLAASVDEVTHDKKVLMDNQTHRQQVDCASTIWSEGRFLASSDDPKKRRFIFPATIPSGTYDEPGQTEAAAPTFSDLPIHGGRALVVSYYEALMHCMADQTPAGQERFKKLLEATVSCYGMFF